MSNPAISLRIALLRLRPPGVISLSTGGFNVSPIPSQSRNQRSRVAGACRAGACRAGRCSRSHRPNHPDAELLRLGVEAIDRVQNDKWNAACAAAGLLTPDIDPDAGPTECSPHVDMFN